MKKRIEKLINIFWNNHSLMMSTTSQKDYLDYYFKCRDAHAQLKERCEVLVFEMFVRTLNK